MVIDTVVNDLVRQRLKSEQVSSNKLVQYELSSNSSHLSDEIPSEPIVSFASFRLSSMERKPVAVAQPPCNLCQKKSNLIVLCEHCQADICELCMKKHYEILTDTLEKKWIECEKKFHQINAYVCRFSHHFRDQSRCNHVFSALSHHNKTIAITKLNQLRETIEERTKNLKLVIENHQQTLARHIDDHIEQLEEM